MDREFKRNAHVLVIDDDANSRKLVRTILHEIGISKIVEASDTVNAVKLLMQQQFDLIICDQHIPGISGIRLVTWLRHYEASLNATVPIILLTGDASSEVVNKAAKCGVDAYLLKPISIHDFDLCIHKILRGDRPVYYRWRNDRQMIAEDLVEPVTETITPPVSEYIEF